MKKLLALLLVFLMLATTVVGCSESKKTDDSKTSSTEDVADNSEDLDDSEDEYADEEEPSDESEEDVSDSEDEYYDDSEDEYYDDSEDEFYDDPEEDYQDDDSYEEPEYDDEEEVIPSTPLSPEEQRLETILLGQDAKINEDAIYNEGNLSRIAKAMKKSQNGELVTIVCYGNGANTSKNSETNYVSTGSYGDLIQEWWASNVGLCKVIFSGTENLTSINACSRVELDVLNYKPDLVFLDFSVQDGVDGLSTTNSLGFDNLIRRILHSESKPAVVTLLLTGAEQTSYSTNPKNANMFAASSKQQKQISKYYDIPVIDFENAVWENFTELVKVTTKKEIPLLTWFDICYNNISMNGDGHRVLAGTVKNFLDGVVKKLNKISTKDPNYPKEGFFGSDKYMKGSFLTVGEILEDKATQDKGYAFDLTIDQLKEYEYSYSDRKDNTTNSLRPNITATRHYIAEKPDDPTDKDKEINPHYLTLTLPEVTNPETYFTVYTSKSFGHSSPAYKPIQQIAPATFVFYDKDGNVIRNQAVPKNTFKDCIDYGKHSMIKLPTGTAKIKFMVYTTSTLRLLGIAEFK